MAKTGDRNLEPQQTRSRESLRKLLKAAREVLGQRGLAETTIPRIAAHAGLTPGAVYRRFRDKEALLEAAILGMLERQAEHMKAGLTPEAVAQIPLPVFAGQIVGSMVVTYRANAPLLRGMRAFARTRRGTPFWKKANRLEIRAYQRLIDLFLTHEAPRPFYPAGRRIDTGKTAINEVLTAMRPRLHLFGHHHEFTDSVRQGVRSIGLDLVGRSYLLIDADTLKCERLDT